MLRLLTSDMLYLTEISTNTPKFSLGEISYLNGQDLINSKLDKGLIILCTAWIYLYIIICTSKPGWTTVNYKGVS